MSFYLNRYSIIFQYRWENKLVKISTGMTTKAFNPKTRRVDRTEDFAWQKNERMDLIEEKFEELKARAMVEGFAIQKRIVEQLIQATAPSTPEVVEEVPLVHQYIRLYKERNADKKAASHLKNFSSLADQFEKWWPLLQFHEVGQVFWERMTQRYIDEGYLHNTIARKVRELKAVVKYASKRSIAVDPTFEDFKMKSMTYLPFYLDWDRDLKKLEEVELDERLDKARDRFLFRCYTGLREGEMNQLQPDNYSEKGDRTYLKYWDIKGKKNKTIQLSDKALALVWKYEFLLPELSQQKENKYIKEVADKAKMVGGKKIIRHSGNQIRMDLKSYSELITTHTARRTFARRWYEQGGDLLKLSKYLGHSSIKTTEIYIGVEDDDVNDEMLRVMG